MQKHNVTFNANANICIDNEIQNDSFVFLLHSLLRADEIYGALFNEWHEFSIGVSILYVLT